MLGIIKGYHSESVIITEKLIAGGKLWEYINFNPETI